jgi:diacylglycerol kinase family enzyme
VDDREVGRWFADAFSIGVDPAILQERNVEREKAKRSPILRTVLRDYNLYAYAVARVPLRHKNVAASVVLDGGEAIRVEHLTNLIVNNVRVYGGEFVFDPDSRPNDGLLDVILFTGWRDYLSKFIVAARRSPINPKVLDKVLKRRSEVHKAARVVVTTARAVDSQVDGEMFLPGARFEIVCVRDALTLKTPVG